VTKTDGIGLVVLMDVSGSMEQSVKGAAGSRPRAKIEIARDSARSIITKTQQFAAQNPANRAGRDSTSSASGGAHASCRIVVPLDHPMAQAAIAALKRHVSQGGTPIGDHHQGKQNLAATGLKRQHFFQVDRWRDNEGYSPQDVVNWPSPGCPR